MAEFQKMANQLLDALRKVDTSQIETVRDVLKRVDLSQMEAALDAIKRMDPSQVETLRDELKRLKSLDLNQVAKALEQAAEALSALQKYLELVRKFGGQGNRLY